jgi:DNA-binding transcriptional LysR family regulator
MGGIFPVNIRRADLNLLYVFDAVIAERNVTRASRRLAMTQPAVSNAIRRLRAVFDDELFLRVPGGIQPTQKALEIWPEVHESLMRLDALLSPPKFRPSDATDTFRLAITDSLTPDLTPNLAVEFTRAAPQAKLHFHHHTNVTSAAELERGGLDCAIGMFPRPPAKLMIDALFTDEYVCAMRTGHPLVGELTVEAFAAAHHVLMKPSGIGHGVVDHWLNARGLSRNVAIVVNHFAEALAIIRNTDLITALPRGFLLGVPENHVGLEWMPLPFETERILYKLAWHERTDRSSAQRWFRSLVCRIANEVLLAGDVVFAGPHTH